MQIRTQNLIKQRELLQKQFATTVVVKPSEIQATSMDQAFLERLMNIVEKHISEEFFNVEIFAVVAGMSTSQMNRKLKALIGQSSGQLLRNARLQRAAELITQQTGTLTEIAYQVGFYDQTHFFCLFKKHFGISPSTYRENASQL